MAILSILQILTSLAGLVLSGVAMRYLRRNVNIIHEKIYSVMMIIVATLLLICFALFDVSLYEFMLVQTEQIPNLQ